MKRRWVLVAALVLVAAGFGAFPAPRALAATTYYSQGSLAPNLTTSWNTVRGGGGSAPANFTAGDVFVIQNGHNMATTVAWMVSGTGATVQIESGGILTANNIVSVPAFKVDDGGSYIHNAASGLSNGSASDIPGSTTRTFGWSSTVEIQKWANGGTSPVALPAVTWGNLTINVATLAGSWNQIGTLTAYGGLAIQATGGTTREFGLVGNSPAAPTIGIDGNLSISGGILNLTSGSASPTVRIGRSFNQTGGTFTSSGAGIATVAFSGGSGSVTFATSGGTFTSTNINWQIADKVVANNTNFGAGSWVASGRTMTVGGVNGLGKFQINQGSWTGSSGTWSYGAGTTLIFNNTSGSYGPIDDTHVYWPASNGPPNVTVQGAGGITLGVARTVAGVFQTAAGVTNGNNLTFNGTAQINAGGYFSGSPTYGTGSTLSYNTGGTYGRGAEWNSTSGAGHPFNVRIVSGTKLNYPNGSTAAQSIAGSLTIAGSSALYMDYGSPGMNNPLTVGGDVNLGILTLGDAPGGDLNVGGNWANDSNMFYANGRAVTFNGSSAQSISGYWSTTFAYLTINNSAGGVALATDQTVNNQLSLVNGRLTLGSHTLNLAAAATVGGTPGAASMVVADNTGFLKKTSSGSLNFTFPVGDSSGAYTPVALTCGSLTSGASADVRLTASVHPQMAGSDYLARYWTMQSNATSATCTGVFRYADGDVNGTESLIRPVKWDGAWHALTSGAVDTGANTLTGGFTSFSDFTGGGYGALAVTLASMTAASQGDGILVTWETVSEIGNAGFNLYRDSSAAGPGVRLNAALIPSQGPNSPSGFSYGYADAYALVPGTTYYYWLEDVSLGGAATRHEPASVTYAGSPTAVSLADFRATAGFLPRISRISRISSNDAFAVLAVFAVIAGAALRLRRRW